MNADNTRVGTVHTVTLYTGNINRVGSVEFRAGATTVTSENREPQEPRMIPATFTASPLLTASDEVTLARTIREGQAAAALLLTNHPTDAQRAALTAAVRAGDDARDRFLLANTRLVAHIAGKYLGRGLDYEDLVSEGTLGLMHALTKFDPERGFKFSTYATPWIRQHITRAIGNHGRTVRLPLHQVEALSKIATTSRALTVRLGRDPELDELAAETGIPAEKIAELQTHARPIVSLDQPVDPDGSATVADMLVTTGGDPAELFEASAAHAAVAAALAGLPVREREVLALRYGFTGTGPQTLSEVGQSLGLTRERVRQIEAHALSRLRHPAAAANLRATR